jgi:hypothetical protein
MPGAYAHITLVNVLSEPKRLVALGFSKPAAAALSDYFKFCELGAVSPDYPYLAATDKNAIIWADLMHYQRTGEFLRAAVDGVRALSGDPQSRAFAWLLGCAAHVATDVTIHPVVELKVGLYATNKRGHRECEMHQDAYIFSKRMNLGGIGLSEHLSSGITRCTDDGKPGPVDTTVRNLWEGVLKKVHPEKAKANPPDVNKWHKAFDFMVNKIAEEGNKLMPIARHVAVDAGLTYPNVVEIDHAEFISRLAVPGGGTQHYDQIFEHALESVGKVWASLERTVFQNDATAIGFIGNWNLDTGRNQVDNKLVFWA